MEVELAEGGEKGGTFQPFLHTLDGVPHIRRLNIDSDMAMEEK